ncbi:hypothetical protein UA08_07084 [Talaromyces atroroseus]|uniref:Uncharacterized protein n=1 Tax=Talaromyces atroroseus TaxID=1441469 RepID=A0A225AHK9_TALAT|nr:hypothetical protein UA08_07084 [Talaromyces atroroseus]OKL57684.1 hypothetical protein UA08_07084 [Talaromyces atroroseus]
MDGFDEEAFKKFFPSSFGKQEKKTDLTVQFDRSKRTDVKSNDEDEDEFPVSHELVLKTHEKAVTTLSVDLPGGRLVSGSADCTIKLHDFPSMTPSTLRAFKSIDPSAKKNAAAQETHSVHFVAFNPISPSQMLVVPATPQPKILDRDGNVLTEFVKGDMYLRDMHNTKGHVSEVTSGAWSPTDYNLCATAGTDSTVRIWDVNVGRNQKEVIAHKSRAAGSAGRAKITAVAWASPKQGGANVLVAAGLDGSLVMWSGDGPYTRPAAEVRDAHTRGTWTSGLDVSADGRLVVTKGGDDTIKLWDTRKFKQPITSVTHQSSSIHYPTSNIKFSPTGTNIITGSETGHLHILNPATLKPELVSPVTPGSPLITVLWHEKLNQILTGSANAETHVLYNPTMSTKGAVLVMSKAPKRRHIDDDPSLTTDISQGFSGDSVVVGANGVPQSAAQSWSARHPTIGLTVSGRPRDPRRPHLPAQTPFAKSQPDEKHIRENIPLSSMRDEDPREALLKYAEKAEKDPIFTKAWAKTQPKTIYAEVSDEEEERPEKKKMRRDRRCSGSTVGHDLVMRMIAHAHVITSVQTSNKLAAGPFPDEELARLLQTATAPPRRRQGKPEVCVALLFLAPPRTAPLRQRGSAEKGTPGYPSQALDSNGIHTIQHGASKTSALGRYAHVRIDQEAEGERVRMRSRRHLSASTYGSIDVPYRDDPDHESYEQFENGQHAQEYTNDRYQFYNDQETGDPDNTDHSVISDHTLRPNDGDATHGDRPSYLHSPYWWAGIVLMSLGELGNFLAYGFAPASIVSPLGVVALISNCMIAPFLLKEKFRARDFWGVVIAVAGAVVVVLSAETSETKIGPHDIWVMITKWEFELYLGLTTALIIILMYLSGKYGSRTILIDLGLVGLFGVASLLSFTLWHVITFPISYLLVAVLVFSALMQVRYINRALQRFDSTQVIPTQFVLFTLSVIIGSAVLYRDFESATLSRALKFVGGCALTFLGVYFITSGRVRHEDELSYGDEDEEAGVRFLDRERYRDSIDEPSALDRRAQKPNNVVVSGPSQLRSSRNSTHSTTSEGQSLSTPKGLLSPAGSDQDESISEDYLSQELATPSPPVPSQSLTSNPWALSEHAGEPDSRPSLPVQESIPATPQGRQLQVAQTPPLLFRFPSAPTTDESPSSEITGHHDQSTNSLQPPADARTPTQRRRSTPRTPQSSSRNSVTLRLTLGSLITPLSSTLSAVVADSLLRGEGNSVKHQRSKSAKTRRLAAAPLIADAFNGENHDTGLVADSQRMDSTTDIRPINSRQTTNADVINSKSDTNAASSMRARSFSDSISGHLAWLGGTLLGSKNSFRAAQQNEDVPSSHAPES